MNISTRQFRLQEKLYNFVFFLKFLNVDLSDVERKEEHGSWQYCARFMRGILLLPRPRSQINQSFHFVQSFQILKSPKPNRLITKRKGRKNPDNSRKRNFIKINPSWMQSKTEFLILSVYIYFRIHNYNCQFQSVFLCLFVRNDAKSQWPTRLSH